MTARACAMAFCISSVLAGLAQSATASSGSQPAQPWMRSFERCLRVKETTPLEPLDRTYKVYAPGVGLIEDGPLKLGSHKYVSR
jgi:hypothetical protein